MTALLGVDLRGRPVLVAGGGPVAARRAAELRADGAELRVVAPDVCEPLRDLLARSGASWVARDALPGDLDGVWFAVAATGEGRLDASVAQWAHSRRVWCETPAAGGAGSARAPATTRAGDVLAGVVVGGGADGSRRAETVRDGLAAALRDGRVDLRRPVGSGRVVLVGGGPGAPDLLTLRARRALAEADVVVTDRLGPVGVLEELAPGVEVVDVGKTPGHHPVPQHEINAILVEQARRGRSVVRLKGGDPFVLGRGGEEVVACREAGVPVEVVPGVSSALGVPALAGIPLTQRGVVTAFHVISGHAGLDGAAQVAVRDACATVVVLMGVSNLGMIVEQALAAGADPGTPVALVENGSTPQERVVRGALGEIVARAAVAKVRAPAVIVIGAVAAEGILEPEPV